MSFIPENARALVEEARDLLLQFHEPDTGQLRTRTQEEIDEWMAKAVGILHTVVTMEAHLPAPDAGEDEQLQPDCNGCNLVAIDEDER